MACEDNGICNPTAPSCIPPLIWRPAGGCQCLDGSLPAWNPAGPVCPEPAASRACTATLAYAPGNPEGVQIVKPTDPACDAVLAAALLAAALAKILEAR